ncbi:hypothetical protein [Pedobacter sp. BMA]|uniref:hypothetical protein n=1 Tax=Pedobacter sp. BMA TaxID=1663685 RepID=UPI00064AFD06|nr:hypothetical protein [Pedobacter sp. BMA]KLT65393.1 hypothetical protein AB669_09895 [Pedobacter sp. BMA]
MQIDSAIRLFAIFLNHAWRHVDELLIGRAYTTNESSRNDWLQANWEFLVERKVLDLNDFLEVYGDGADFYGASSRITDVDSASTVKIVAIPKSGDTVYDVLNDEDVDLSNSVFDRLVGFDNGFYILEPDFNFVLLFDENIRVERVVRLNDVKFDLDRL